MTENGEEQEVDERKAEILPRDRMREIARLIRNRASLDGDSGNVGEELQAQFAERVSNAATLDDIFDANEEEGLDDVKTVLGIPLSVVDVMFRVSSEKYAGNGTLGVYCVVTAFTDQGEEKRFSVGGAGQVPMSLFRIEQLGGCNKDNPTRLRFLAKPSGNGDRYIVGRA